MMIIYKQLLLLIAELEGRTGKRPNVITLGASIVAMFGKELNILDGTFIDKFDGIEIQITKYNPNHISVGYTSEIFKK